MVSACEGANSKQTCKLGKWLVPTPGVVTRFSTVFEKAKAETTGGKNG